MPDCDETRSRWRPFIGMDPGFGQSVSSTFGI
jgi:chitodextrinase